MAVSWRGWLDAWQARQARQRREREEAYQWFLLAGYCAVDACRSPRPEALQPLYPPADRFWADPFAWRREGRYYVFFEEYPYATRRGHISVMELDGAAQPAGAPRPVIQEPYHLSYPCLFEFGGELYMIPEKKAARRVDLYRCVAFPDRWEVVRTWFKSARMVDCTVFEHGGRWWLFCSVKGQGLRYDETLLAYHAETPLTAEWTPHPGNPLVRDYSRGRCGGRVLRDSAGRLLRPSQDCVRHYGDGLNVSEITQLSLQHYAEQRLWHRAGEAAGWHGLHHLDWHAGLMVMDAQRILRREDAAEPPG